MAEALKGVFPLQGAVQNYAWGGKDFIAELFGIDQTDQKPIAEYWVGVHSRGMAKIYYKGSWQELQYVSKLPYLLKILDVNEMLSIQSHPNKQQAEIGFANEERKKIPLNAKHRVFKDDNHKPELMVALSDFWLLHGFKSEEDIQQTISSVPEFKSLEVELQNGIESLYTFLMKLGEVQLEEMLTPLKVRLSKENPSSKDQPDYWANLAFDKYGFDRGIFSIYLFNLVQLKEGEAIYQEAGIPHAYLEGKNIEIMANSDNVFRAGLTPKHIDVDLLLAHLDFAPVVPQLIQSTLVNAIEKVYKSPAKEFELRVINLSIQDYRLNTKFDECYIVLKGGLTVVSDDRIHNFRRGDCFFVKALEDIIMKPQPDTKLVRATLPH